MNSLNMMLASAVAMAGLVAPAFAAPNYATVNMTIDEEPIVPALAESLGCLEREHIKLNVIDIMKLVDGDWQMQVPLADGRVDVAYHWFNHTVFGARHRLPVVAVMNFNDAPGMTVFVQNTKRGEIRSPADFKGRSIASGALYGTKSVITAALARKAGVSQNAYAHAAVPEEGREAAVKAGLKAATIDVATSEEPLTKAIEETGTATALYRLTDRAGTQRVLGAGFPAQSLLMAPKFMKTKPAVAQRVVNAFVCTMRYVNKHDPATIVAHLPKSYLAGKDRAVVTEELRRSFSTFAKADYRIRAMDAAFVTRSIEAFQFDTQPEGVWRQANGIGRVDPKSLYDNSFVERAMKQIP